MATAVVMPKQGQSVESCIIVEWKKLPGDAVAEGEILCEVETDKAVLEVPSPVAGTLLAHFFAAGDDVPVLTPIAAVGAVGEDVSALRPAHATTAIPNQAAPPAAVASGGVEKSAPKVHSSSSALPADAERVAISPRARHLAEGRDVDMSALRGSGPGGRIIERDVQAALATLPRVSPVAKAMVASGDFTLPDQGSGPGGRIMARDLASPASSGGGEESHKTDVLLSSPPPPRAGEIEVIPIRGVRKVIADRMLASLQTTAQLTLHMSADAQALLTLRKRFKASDAALELQPVTINDLVHFAVTRTLPHHPALNATFAEGAVTHFGEVHLGFAVDTPRGLLVPVIRQAQRMSLRDLAREAKRLTAAIQAATISPDEMTGGTFTVTNLGNLGIEHFTPILNVPQVAILGVGGINLKSIPVNSDFEGEVEFVPHIALSLTIDHQVVDGAPGARFLHELARNLQNLDLLLAI